MLRPDSGTAISELYMELNTFYGCNHFIWDVFDSDSSVIGSEGSGRLCQPRSLVRLFKGDGKQVLFGSLPSLISSIHSNEHGMTDREHQGRVLIPMLINS
jgi:hypothetical protein